MAGASIVSMVDPRALLEEERQHTLRRLSGLAGDFDEIVEASRDSNADDEHDPDGSTIAFERAQVGELVRQAKDRLSEIDAAIGRLNAGVYGVCENCGQPIATDRLEARPVARTCIECASR